MARRMTGKVEMSLEEYNEMYDRLSTLERAITIAPYRYNDNKLEITLNVEAIKDIIEETAEVNFPDYVLDRNMYNPTTTIGERPIPEAEVTEEEGE